MFKKFLFLFTFSLLSFSNFAEEISYSGRLVEPTTGTPLTGPVSLSIKIYTEFPASTFNLRCSQNSPSTNLSNGVFNIQISYSSRCDSNTKDLSTIIEEATSNNQKLYIEVEDTTNSKVYEKQLINFAPMALYAKKASSVALADKSLDVVKLTSSCGNGQVLKSDGAGGFSCANDETGLSSAITNVSSGEATNVTITSNDATIDVLYDNTTIGLNSNQLEVKDAAITNAKLADNSISSAKIQDNSVTTSKIPSNAIATAHIQNGAITDVKITSISSSKLSGTIPDANLPAITSTHIQDGTITGADIASATIDLNQLDPTSCSTDQIVKYDLILNQFICADASSLSTNAWTENSGDIYRTTGKVGIGTSSPTKALHVVASDTEQIHVENTSADGSAQIAFINDADSWQMGVRGDVSDSFILRETGAGDRLTILAGGNIGIGTNTPTEKLEVNGKVKGSELCIGTVCRSSWPSDTSGTVTNIAGAANGAIDVSNGTTSAEVATRVDGLTLEVNGSNNLQVKDSGISNAKIATGIDASKVTTGSLPDSVLSTNVSKLGSTIESAEITDGTIADSDISATASIAWTKVDKTGAAAGDIGAVADTTTVTAGTGLTGGGSLSSDITLNADLAAINYWTKASTALGYTAGNIGIGTSAPTKDLHIQRTGASNDAVGINIENTATNGGNYYLLSTSDGHSLGAGSFSIYDGAVTKSRFTVRSNGHIGVGTNSPMSLLSLAGSDDKDNGPILTLSGSSINQTEGGRIRFTEGNGTYQGSFIHYDASSTNLLHIGVHETNDSIATSDSNVITIRRNNGNVGIKNEAPTTALDVSGTVKATSFSGDGSALTNVSSSNSSNTTDVVLSADSDSNSSGSILLQTSGSTKATLTNTGSLGLGLTSPASKFHIKQSSDAAHEGFRITNNANTASFGIYVDASDNTHLGAPTGSPDAIVLDNDNGNIGFGTSAPVVDLHIKETTNSQATLRLESNRDASGASTAVIDFMAPLSPAPVDAKNFQLMNVNGASGNRLTVGSNSDAMNSFSPLFNILHSGYVGIGTTAPKEKFQVNGSSLFNTSTNTNPLKVTRLDSNSNEYLSVGIGDTTTDFHYYNDEAFGQIRFSVTNSDTESNAGANANSITAFTIRGASEGASIGVGTGTPAGTAHFTRGAGVNGDAIVVIESDTDNNTSYENSNPILRLLQDSGISGVDIAMNGNDTSVYDGAISNAFYIQHIQEDTGTFQFVNKLSTETNPSAKVTITNTGRVGIGTTTPSEQLEVANNVKATSYLTTSDRRLKKEIYTIDSALEKILQLRGVSFVWKRNDLKTYGFIAQEVEEIFPELVVTDKITGLKAVKYANLVAPLVESVKELNINQIENERRIASLEEENTILKKKIENQSLLISTMIERLERLEKLKKDQ
ncbi:tail fiber domain-containing protein [Halobacteriovorax sp. GB3]|uniref:tail fiber domain-containing protein n=1 Tax=Halobacteriovorax sp. GB3 TaxID=2719615 RepID=UPI002362BC24|nr:tail fiber domain-containing protein [Halobacteriovorax sp. GB3]MDD0853717.1 tail fiber domain-containing protein [Halobacteriovorax sp. GB3]